MAWQRYFLGAIVTVGYAIDEKTRNIGLNMIKAVRSAAAQSSRPWTESEWRIAEAFIKFLVTGEQSALLVARLAAVSDDSCALCADDTPRFIRVEIDRLVGLLPEQQLLIQRIYDEEVLAISASEVARQES